MNNSETAAHMRNWVINRTRHNKGFGWPTDACGYDQHVRFVEHRNNNWSGNGDAEFDDFIFAYAAMLEAEVAPSESQHSWDKSWREWPERLTAFEVRLINSAIALRSAWPPPMTSPPRREDWEKAAKALREFENAVDEYLE